AANAVSGFMGMPPCRFYSLLIENVSPADALALDEHCGDALVSRNVLQRIAIHQQQAGFVALADQADALIDAQQAGGVVGGSLEGGRGWNPRLDPELQLAMNAWAVDYQRISGVGAGDQDHTGAKGRGQIQLRQIQTERVRTDSFAGGLR